MKNKLEILMWIPGLFFLFLFYVWFSFDEASMSKNYLEEMRKTNLKIEKVLTLHAIYTVVQIGALIVAFAYLTT